MQVPSGHVSHADGPGGAVQKLVAVPAVARGSSHWPDLKLCFQGGRGSGGRVLLVHGVIKLGDALVSPVFTQLRQNVAKHV